MTAPLWSSTLGRRIVQTLTWGLLLGLAYAQSPLVTSNQNQYFLHGAAQAGIGDLAQDWLANTIDSVPVFSLLVEVTFRWLHPYAFYLYYLVLFGVYLCSLMSIVEVRFDPDTRLSRWVFLALMIGVHSAALRFLLGRGLGAEWEYLFDGGVAAQRLLGPVFQPSCFGVLLLVSIERFNRRHPVQAIGAAVLAATIHPTYLLGAAVLTATYLLVEWRDTHRWQRPLGLGALALVLVTPIGLYVLLALGSTSPAIWREAQQILVDFRIPHHAMVSEWLDATTLVKLALIVGSLILARKGRLFTVILVSLAAALALTVLQVATNSTSLALLFPWRLSAYLVPVASAVVVGWVTDRAVRAFDLERPSRRRWTERVAAAVVSVCVLAGIIRFAIELQQQRLSPAREMLVYVAQHRSPREVYLIPPRLQEFRLATGAAALVDFKSIPYRDVEVLAWYERVRLAEWFYRDRVEYVDCELLDRFVVEYRVSHVVLGQDLLDLACPQFQAELYRDQHYAVYRLAAVEPAP